MWSVENICTFLPVPPAPSQSGACAASTLWLLSLCQQRHHDQIVFQFNFSTFSRSSTQSLLLETHTHPGPQNVAPVPTLSPIIISKSNLYPSVTRPIQMINQTQPKISWMDILLTFLVEKFRMAAQMLGLINLAINLIAWLLLPVFDGRT